MLLGVALGGAACAWLAGGRTRTLAGARPGAAANRDSAFDVVIPARDEEVALARLLASLRRSASVPQRVIVVDDGSTDGTAAVARQFGAEVVDPGEPPIGWTGKCWACHQGAATATAGVLVFLDADVSVAPTALGDLVALHRRVGGLVSVQPHHTTEAPYEQLSALCNAVAVLGSGLLSPIGRWRGRAVAAVGPCLATSARDYRAVGGHAVVRGQVAEDVALAACYRAAGLATNGVLGADQVVYRMYPDGVGQLLDGWSKNLAVGAVTVSRPAVALATAWIASLMAVATSGAVVLLHWAVGGPPAWTAALAWAVAAAGVHRASSRVGTFGPLTALAFPVPLAVFVGAFVRSVLALVTRGSVSWRGRPVPVGRGVVEEARS